MYICIDFDGTVVTHEYPYIGSPVPGALETLKDLIAKGHKLILFTMRSGEPLKDAIEFCGENGIHFYGINENPDQKAWTLSQKAYGHIYIDDAALGCPLIQALFTRPYVDWVKIREILVEKGVL